MKEPKKEFLENSPIFKRWWNSLVEKLREQEAKSIAAMTRAHSERGLVFVAILIALGVIGLTGLLLNQYGSYCEYPDPYGR